MEKITLVFKVDTFVYDFFGKSHKYKKGEAVKALYNESKNKSNGGIISFKNCLYPASNVKKYCNITYF